MTDNTPIYLDYAAATPVDDRVLRVMKPYFSDIFHNPSSEYTPARQAKEALENSRKTIAEFLGSKPKEIIFTAGGTEANNLAILGTATSLPKGHFVATAIEHDSVLQPLAYLKSNGRRVTLVKPSKEGTVKTEAIEKAINDDTVLVNVMHANNEIGSIQPIRSIARLLQEVKRDRQKRGVDTPIYFHSDACQTTQYLDMHVSRLGVDMMTINSDKIYGPKQCGALFVKSTVDINAQIFGGNQEFGLRSGTQNVPSVVGFGEAIKLVSDTKKEETARVSELQRNFLEEILKIKTAKLNGAMKNRLPNNLNVSFEGMDNERLLMELDNLGIYVSTGSACSASKSEPSYVLSAIGLSKDRIGSSLRFSFGRQTTHSDLKKTATTIRRLVV